MTREPPARWRQMIVAHVSGLLLLAAVDGGLPATAGEIADLLASRADELVQSPASRDAAELHSAGFPYRRVGLERGRACALEPCPSYTLLIYADGSVRYDGQGFDRQDLFPNGQRIMQLDSARLFEIRAYLETLDLDSLDMFYGVRGKRAAWAIVLIETDERQDLIANYGHGAPVAIWALIDMLENAALTTLYETGFD